MANETKYWKGLSQLNNEKEFSKKHDSEFAEYIPVEEFIGNKSAMEDSSTNRRDFLKFLGFSTVAATLAACEAPVTKAVPYVNRPEEITPGVANYYASTYFDGNDYCSVLVKTREGRPIKIEGNDSPDAINMGATNARVQASVLSLYDSNRLKGAMMKSGNGHAEVKWEDADEKIKARLAQAKGIAIVSSTIISPSTKQAIAEFKGKYASTRHVTYDAISYAGMLKANLSTFGAAMIPTYRLDNAQVIVSLGADFLANWISPIEHARQYSKVRKVSKDKREMAKHYQFETILSLTGANADERFNVKPSQLGQVALGLLAGVGGGVSAPNVLSKEVAKVAESLKAANGKAVVLCGSNDPAVQLVVNQINQKIGAYGSTIHTDIPDYTHQGDDTAVAKLVEDINNGAVDTVIFYNSNPSLTAPKALGFEAAMGKLATRISFAGWMDETASKCDFVCPDHYYLEAWNDHNPRKNHYNLQQPAIRPLFKTRHAQESLLTWAGNKTDWHTYIANYWKNNFLNRSRFGDFATFWNKSVHDGVVVLAPAVAPIVEDKKPAAVKPVTDTTATAEPVVAVANSGEQTISFTGGTITLDAAVSQLSAAKGGKYELVIYQKTGIGNGNQSSNPWLQEMPDPISKITWDNYITMNPADVAEKKLFGVEDGSGMMVRFDQMEDELDVVSIKANGYEVKLPVWPQPGQTRGTVGIAVGYGRKGYNEVIDSLGQNIYPAVGLNANGTMSYEVFDVAISDATGERHPIAATQTHHTLMGRNKDIIRETTLAEYKKDERAGNPLNTLHTYKGEQMVENVTLWNDFERPNHQWALAIDLNACIGCGACVVACNAENNVSVVGKEEVRKSREMHWMRIDRYFSSDTVKEKVEETGEMGTMAMYRSMENPSFDNPKVVFQPLMCQHCNHAPCETVCPVLATNHSSEGLNQMTYNRCVGTRYCANNCPYKVRRFNWFNYVEYHRFKNINPAQDDLGRMVLNPDVTVRSRGVMEKCSMCVQRIQAGKLEAKKAGVRPKDGSINTACAQSCPTNAITFGDLNDQQSKVAEMEQDSRKYEVLEVIGVKPSVFYMTKVWNREDENAHL